MKRSSRARDLKKEFKVSEMSSISTLEFAWEHFPWGTWGRKERVGGKRDFCYQVALTNKLELLKWIRVEKKCEWNEWTINAAARQGNLEMVKYCVANECPIRTWACAFAAENGHLESASNTYAKKSKRLGILILPLGRLKMVTSTYSNILLSVSMINITHRLVSLRRKKVS